MSNTPAEIKPEESWEEHLFKHDRQLLHCRFSPCGQFLFGAGTDSLVHRWNVETAEHTALAGHDSWIGALAFHPDGKRLMTADYIGGIRAWTYAEKEPKPLWSVDDAHQGSIRSLLASANGSHLVTAGHDQMVRVWTATEGKRVHEFAGHQSPLFAAGIHPDSVSVVSAEQHGIVKHWDIITGKLVRDLDAKVLWYDESLNGGGHSCGIRSLTFDAEGKTLAAAGISELKDGDRRGGNSHVLLFDWKSGKSKLSLLAKGQGYAERALIHPTGHVIAACLTQERGSIQFWKTDNAEPIHKIASACRDLDLSPDGTRIAVVEWEKDGKVGNNPSTEKLEEYKWNKSVIRVFAMTPKPAEAEPAAKAG